MRNKIRNIYYWRLQIRKIKNVIICSLIIENLQYVEFIHLLLGRWRSMTEHKLNAVAVSLPKINGYVYFFLVRIEALYVSTNRVRIRRTPQFDAVRTLWQRMKLNLSRYDKIAWNELAKKQWRSLWSSES